MFILISFKVIDDGLNAFTQAGHQSVPLLKTNKFRNICVGKTAQRILNLIFRCG